MTHGNNRIWHRWIIPALGASVVIILAALQQAGFGPLLRLEYYTQDLRARQGRKAAPHPALVFLGVDRGTCRDVFLPEDYESTPLLHELDRNFPWSRVVWAALIEKLAAAGAKVVALDFLFTAPGDGDDALRAALERHRDKVVLGSAFSEANGNLGKSFSYTAPAETLITPQATEDDRVGFVNLWPDWDDVIRHARFRLSDDSWPAAGSNWSGLESLAGRVLRKAGDGGRVPKGAEAIRFRYAGPPGAAYPYRPFHEVFVPAIWQRNYQNGEYFRGKIVIVGPAANFFHDEHLSPFESPRPTMFGPELHLQIIGAALQGEFIRASAPAWDWVWTLAGLGSVWFLMQRTTKTSVRLPLLAAGMGAYAWGAQALFNHASLVVPVAVPLLSSALTGLVILGQDFVRERLERMRLRRTLERYVSKDIVREIVDKGTSFFLNLEGVRKPVTILFSDLRGFTTLTERADSALLVKQLNEYFEKMVEIVFKEQGTLDKFIGDAVMAHWGSIVSHGIKVDAVHAVQAALEMHRGLAALNRQWKARGLPELSIGIGINHGEVIVGNLGSNEKMELTVIGDVVNLASRLEGLTKEYQLGLILGQAAADLVAEQFVLRSVDRVCVKGKHHPVDVFTVVGPIQGNTPLPSWLIEHEAGVRSYWRRDFQAAVLAFSRSADAKPDDPLTGLYLERCKTLILHPPDDQWDGVFVMTRK